MKISLHQHVDAGHSPLQPKGLDLLMVLGRTWMKCTGDSQPTPLSHVVALGICLPNETGIYSDERPSHTATSFQEYYGEEYREFWTSECASDKPFGFVYLKNFMFSLVLSHGCPMH